MIKEFISIFFNISLGFFTLASTILALYSINNRLRLRQVRIRWRAGKLAGFPLFSSLYLISSILVMILMISSGNNERIEIMWAFLWLSTMWFISSYLASKTYITAHGIVKNVNEPAQTIAWYQIIDFAEKASTDGETFTFVYRENEENQSLHRLTIEVPQSRINEFKKIVSYRLEKRIESDISKITSEKEN